MIVWSAPCILKLAVAPISSNSTLLLSLRSRRSLCGLCVPVLPCGFIVTTFNFQLSTFDQELPIRANRPYATEPNGSRPGLALRPRTVNCRLLNFDGLPAVATIRQL